MACRVKKAGGLSRREVLKSAAGGAVAVGLSPFLWIGGCKRAGRVKRPNVIFIVIDTLRADHVGCCGWERNTTPNIDRLAQDALLFTGGIAASPWTLPSVASMLTGRHRCALGMREKITSIPEGRTTIAEVLERNGYSTYGVVSHTLLSGRLGFGRGFDKYDEQSCFGHGGISSPAVTCCSGRTRRPA